MRGGLHYSLYTLIFTVSLLVESERIGEKEKTSPIQSFALAIEVVCIALTLSASFSLAVAVSLPLSPLKTYFVRTTVHIYRYFRNAEGSPRTVPLLEYSQRC